MLEIVGRNCVNCGATLGRNAVKCEYCGTEYKREMEVTHLGICTAPNTDTIHAQVSMEYRLLKKFPDAKKYVVEKLARAIAKELLQYMTIDTYEDPCSFSEVVRAKVEVVKPNKHQQNVCDFL